MGRQHGGITMKKLILLAALIAGPVWGAEKKCELLQTTAVTMLVVRETGPGFIGSVSKVGNPPTDNDIEDAEIQLTLCYEVLLAEHKWCMNGYVTKWVRPVGKGQMWRVNGA